MDILDQAQDYEIRDRAASIATARAAVADGPGRKFCLKCEELISPARRRALPGSQLCINCQRTLENENA